MVFASRRRYRYNQIMSYDLEAVKHKPESFFLMDDTSPLQDYSPYNKTATIVGGTPARAPALVSGAVYSQVFTNAITAQYTTNVFTQGQESQPFSLTASLFPVKTNPTGADAPQKILSNAAGYDGLTINGTVVSFSTNYTSTGTATCSYDLQSTRNVNVVGTHTESKNSLYVNGVLVAEVDITPEQQTDTFIATDGKLYSGASTSPNGIALNGIGMYHYALPVEVINSMHLAARNTLDADDVATLFGGDTIHLSHESADIFIDQTWSTKADWLLGGISNVTVVDDQLVPQFNADTSLAGSWTTTIPLTAADTTSMYGVSFDWEGSGVLIEASLTGTTWETVVRGVGLNIIPVGFDPTGKDLIVRVSFAGGIIDDPSYIDNLSLLAFRTGIPPILSGRTITFSKAYQQKHHLPVEMQDQWGAEILSGGSITIGADTTSAAVQPRTVAIWIKPTSTTLPTFTLTGTKYQDGVANSGALMVGKWTLLHFVEAANITGSIKITGPAQVGQVTLYDTALSAGTIANISAAYSKANSLLAGDSSVIGVTQSPAGATIYAHDWAIVGAG